MKVNEFVEDETDPGRERNKSEDTVANPAVQPFFLNHFCSGPQDLSQVFSEDVVVFIIWKSRSGL